MPLFPPVFLKYETSRVFFGVLSHLLFTVTRIPGLTVIFVLMEKSPAEMYLKVSFEAERISSPRCYEGFVPRGSTPMA